MAVYLCGRGYSAQEFSENVTPVMPHHLPVAGTAGCCPFGECFVCSALLISFQEMCRTFVFFPSVIYICIYKIIIGASLSDLENDLPEPSSWQE